MNGIEWGDVPTWVGAGFAALAAAATVWTLKSQRDQIDEQRGFIGEQSRNLSLEREALLAAAQERREAQARQIRLFPKDPEYVQVINGSGEPITDVHCETRDMPAVSAVELGPNQSFTPVLLASQLQGADRPFVERVGAGREAWFRVVTNQHGTVTIRFTDAGGNRWALDDAGKLDAAVE